MVMKKLKTRKLICICSGIILLILAGAFIYYKHHMGRMISSVYHPVSVNDILILYVFGV